MSLDNGTIADGLNEIAVLLELKGENPFKTRAYTNAARVLEGLEEPLSVYVAEGRLGDLKGIGDALQKKLTEWVETGRLGYYEDLKASFPAGVLEMMGIPGLGPKKVKALYDKLKIESVKQLEEACKRGEVAGLSGFGEKTQSKILEGIQFQREHQDRFRLDVARGWAEGIREALRGHPDTIRLETAGSLRRFKEVVGDLDFVVSSKHPEELIRFFTELPQVSSVIAKGDTKASVRLEDGMQADLRVVSDAEFPFALVYFTGSKEHNIVMRQRAIQRGLRLNEYGLFRSKEETRDPALRVSCNTEEDVFRELGLSFIPPELREDSGEFEWAERGGMGKRLVEWTDLKGSLHNHSNWSDGRQTLKEIVEQIIALGCEYWAITDHSQASFQANGLSVERLTKQMEAIEELNRHLEGEGESFRLLTGTEVDVLSEGRLDYSTEVLESLEVVVASIHSGMTSDEAEMTKKLIRAAEHPMVTMLGHLTGRLLLERKPYPVNQKAVIDACAETGTWIELNASPYRLDMDWRMWGYAKKKGVKCVINTDTHRLEHVGFFVLGAGLARKGGLGKEDVVNTLGYGKLKEALRAQRAFKAKK